MGFFQIYVGFLLTFRHLRIPHERNMHQDNIKIQTRDGNILYILLIRFVVFIDYLQTPGHIKVYNMQKVPEIRYVVPVLRKAGMNIMVDRLLREGLIIEKPRKGSRTSSKVGPCICASA